MHVKHIALLIAFAALTAFGCSPTMLGDRELTAEKPLLNDVEEFGEAKIKSSGENLDVTITIPPANDVCHGKFTFTDSATAIPGVPGSAPSLLYAGKFDDGLSAKCLALLGAPGGTPMAVIIQTPPMGTDNMFICTEEQRVGNTCVGSKAVYIIQDL